MTTITKLADLADAFNKAIAQKQASDPAFAQTMLSSFGPAEVEKIMDLTGEFMDAAQNSKHLEAAMNGDATDLKSELAPKAVALTDYAASVMSKSFSEQELSALMPEEAHTDEIAQAYEDAGAPTLAKLCRPLSPA